jgi:O-antigen/teichoic acid export membrane protein
VTAGRLASRPNPLATLHRDPLVRNSFFLMLTTLLGAGSGFLFWLIVARLFSTAAVGEASSLLSSVALLSYFSLFGFSSALIRFLPTSADRAADTGTASSAVSLCGVVMALGFAVAAPWLASELGFVRSSGTHLLLFVVLATCAAVNLLTDSIFVACRATNANLLINGVLMNVVKLALLTAAVTFDAFGIFAASGVASAVAAVVSIAVIRRHLRIPFRLRIHRDSLRRMVRYSLSSYLSGCLNLVPQLALPLIVLHQLGPVRSAVYFMAFQIANLVNSASYAIGESLFAEGSHEGGNLRAIAFRSAGLMLAVTGAAAGLLMLLAGPALTVFGADYASAGTRTLILFALSSLAVAFNTWASFLLKITRELRALTVSNIVFVVVTIGVALAGIPHGLPWAAVAWSAGHLLSGGVAAFALVPKAMQR